MAFRVRRGASALDSRLEQAAGSHCFNFVGLTLKGIEDRALLVWSKRMIAPEFNLYFLSFDRMQNISVNLLN